jgi:pyruvate dehydrogenase (quinone)
MELLETLNPVIDALRRNGTIEFIHVRHEKYGVLAAVAEAYMTGNLVAVCGTAGPGVVHLFNGLMDARKKAAPIIAIAGDLESSLIDTSSLEELNPSKSFETASLYTARLVNPEQARAVINTAILTAVLEKGLIVISIPGDVASADAGEQSTEFTIAAPGISHAGADHARSRLFRSERKRSCAGTEMRES